MTDTACDVAVIGGGPAGSTAATLLARRGWSVLLLEKAQHPRFHIGESLLPLNMPILQELGVYEAVATIGVLKHGAEFAGDGPDESSKYYFEDALDCRFPHAFQVKREEFDELLFRHAAANGVDARENIEVRRIGWTGSGAADIESLTADGRTLHFSARYVIDASGRDTLLGRQMKLKRKDSRHQSAAIYAHYRNVEQRPGRDAGNISVYWLRHGWMWMIPLRGGITSVGCVCSPAYLKQRRDAAEEFLRATVAEVPAAAARMRNAALVSDAQASGNYSYRCKRLAGPGWILVGDAGGFIDPVFSSGVHLAMSSARNAVEAVDAILRQPRLERRLQRAYTRHHRRAVQTFSWFIYRFTTPALRALFTAPSYRLGIANAVTSVLAGDIFGNRRVARRLAGFRAIYAWTAFSSRHLRS